jgi:tetratricopeptide (TPR) repeat protein
MRKQHILTFIVFLALLLVTLTANAADELFDTKAASEHIDKGIAYLKENNFDAAINEFDESASISPEAEPYYYLGYTYYLKSRKGDIESRKLSLDNFDKAYEIDPNFTPMRYKPKEQSSLQERQQQEINSTEASSTSTMTPEAQKPAETSAPQLTR